MRVGSGTCKFAQLDTRPWEAFQASKLYTTTLAISWTRWDILVQYRDTQGNLSPVVCDDILLEGMPPTPTQR